MNDNTYNTLSKILFAALSFIILIIGLLIFSKSLQINHTKNNILDLDSKITLIKKDTSFQRIQIARKEKNRLTSDSVKWSQFLVDIAKTLPKENIDIHTIYVGHKNNILLNMEGKKYTDAADVYRSFYDSEYFSHVFVSDINQEKDRIHFPLQLHYTPQ
jgi:hypothetical protein